ncbi:CheR methyltransferase, SAM binding domain protein [Tepidicaulis marinus]|uniref:protein-glutamate O-methyltransferase n=1 Tax=Tepidicaulis marinus TaxID=1333998 RepID=A0A081BEK5_9HYPH|nr:protein-glutamate O-methyltransferase CheR [Tepidicaulis marinus]GAK46473.1 CheR methyltransferase, SAM binding domain protein [Tepidicaulis marinus]
MRQADFEYLAKFLKERSGLVLTPNKEYLIESRLLPIARDNGFEDIEGLVGAMRPGAVALLEQVTEAMTTNESFFFRDKTPFEMFEKVILPHLLDSRSGTKRFRIWCAAASTGQEPYSLAMQMKEMGHKLANWRQEIIGTDLSADVLRRAKLGKYTQFEVQRGLPIQLLVKYFKQIGHDWEISPDIRSMVQYRKLNLLEEFSALGQFDVVFCRNVLIYFDQQTKAQVLERIAKQLAPDGFLVLGAAETVIGITKAFKPLKGCRGLYVPAEADVSKLERAAVA